MVCSVGGKLVFGAACCDSPAEIFCVSVTELAAAVSLEAVDVSIHPTAMAAATSSKAAWILFMIAEILRHEGLLLQEKAGTGYPVPAVFSVWT
jgi:hypothetical protein